MIRRRSNISFFLNRFDSEYKMRTTNFIIPVYRNKLMLKGFKLFPNSGTRLVYPITSHFYRQRFNLKRKYCHFFLHNYFTYFFYRHGNSDFYKKGLKGSLILKKLQLSIWLDSYQRDINLIFLNPHFFFKTFSTNCLFAIGSVWTYLKYLKGHREMLMAPLLTTKYYKNYLNNDKSSYLKFKYKNRVMPRYELLKGNPDIILNLPKAHSAIKYKTNRSSVDQSTILGLFKYIIFFKNTLSFINNFLLILKYLMLNNFK